MKEQKAKELLLQGRKQNGEFGTKLECQNSFHRKMYYHYKGCYKLVQQSFDFFNGGNVEDTLKELKDTKDSLILERKHNARLKREIELLKRLIEIHSNKGSVVLDCFGGSFSTGLACMELGRDFIGIEIDEDIFNSVKKDFETLKRNHKFFFDKLEPIIKGTDIFTDFENIYKEFYK